MKGAVKDEGEPNTTPIISYLGIPLNLAYKYSFTEKSDFFIQAGPYLGYGLSGKLNPAGKVLIFSAEGGLKRFDYGVGFGAGVEFGSLVASLNYQLGLMNLLEPMSSDFLDLSDMKLKNKVFQISIAYMFVKKK